MTQALGTTRSTTPAPRALARDSAVASVWVRGAVAALSGVAVVLAPLIVAVLALWAVDAHSGSSAGTAARVAVSLWLVAQRVPLHVADGSLALAPLGLTAIVLLVLGRAASVVAAGSKCRTPGDVLPVVAAVVGPYAVLMLALSFATSGSAAAASPAGAVVSALLIGGTTAAVGALHGAGQWRSLWQLLPDRVRVPLLAGGAGLGALVAMSMLATLVTLLAHSSAFATALTGPSAGGIADQGALVLVTVLLLPNAAVFGLSYLSGPGFALGAGSHVGVLGSYGPALPAFPLLSARPQGPAPDWALALLVLVVIGASAVTAWLVARSSPPTLLAALRDAGLAAAAAGVGAAVLVAVAGGPAGPGRFASVGGSPWQTGLAVAAEIGLVTAIGVTARVWTDVVHALRSSAPEPGVATDSGATPPAES